VWAEDEHQKTKVMFGQAVNQKEIRVDNIIIEQVEEYIYLGQKFSLRDRNQEKEIQRKINAGWGAFAKYSDSFRRSKTCFLSSS